MRRVLLVLLCILIAAIGAISQESMKDIQSTSAEMAGNGVGSQGIIAISLKTIELDNNCRDGFFFT